MPKYYRFRPISPPRKTKWGDDGDVDKDKGDLQKLHERGLELTPAQLWYLRRTAWREPARPAVQARAAGAARQLASRWMSASSRYAREASFAVCDALPPSGFAQQTWRFTCLLM